MSKLLDTMLEMSQQSRDVLYIEGAHGIGKSEMVAEWAEKKGMKCRVLMLSQNEVGDLIGIPNIKDGITTSWAMPDWFNEIIEDDKDGTSTVLFLDEISRGAQDVKASIFDLVLNGKLHTHKLPKSTLIVAAANPAGKKYQVSSMDPALMNRFCFMTLSVNVVEWLEYAKEKQLHPAVIDFITKHEDKLFFQDDKTSIQSATPRSWTKLSANLRALENLEANDDAIRTTIVGKLGIAIGGQFFTYYGDRVKLFGTKDVLKFIKDNKSMIDTSSDKKYQASIEKLADKFRDVIKDFEHIQLVQVTEKFVEEFFEQGLVKTDLDTIEGKLKVLPNALMLTAVPLEVAATLFETFKADQVKYALLWNSDVEQTIVRKCVAAKTKDPKWLKAA